MAIHTLDELIEERRVNGPKVIPLARRQDKLSEVVTLHKVIQFVFLMVVACLLLSWAWTFASYDKASHVWKIEQSIRNHETAKHICATDSCVQTHNRKITSLYVERSTLN